MSRNWQSILKTAIKKTVLVSLVLSALPIIAVAKPAIAVCQVSMANLTIEQLQQAADAGDPDAQYALGYMYYYGKNVAEDQQQALNWIKRAAVQGQKQALQAMAILGQSVTVTPSITTIEPVNPAPPAPTVSSTRFSQTSYATTNESVVTVKPSKPSTKRAAPAIATPVAASGQYTIQLIASAKPQVLSNYIKTHHLQGRTNQYQTTRQGKPWYVLVYGLYGTKQEAQAAVAGLPASVRAQKPWVRPVEKNTSTQAASSKKTKSTSSSHKK